MDKKYTIIEADGIMWIAEKRKGTWWIYNPLNNNWEDLWHTKNLEVKIIGEFSREMSE